MAAVVGVSFLPFLELVAANPRESLALWRIALAAGVTAVLGVAVLALLRRRSATTARAAVFLGAGLWLFFHTPTIEGWFARLELGGPILVKWGLAAAFLFIVLLPASHHPGIRTWLLVVAVLAPLVPIAQIVSNTVSASEGPEDSGDVGDLRALRTPNVYFFMTDGYARADVMEEMTGLDITPFLSDLAARGFVVSDDAIANYPTTFASLASTLDMEYLVTDEDQITRYSFFYRRLQGDNRVIKTFWALGYQYLHAYNGVWDGTECPDYADHCIGQGGVLTPTDWAMLAMTPVGDLVATATMLDRWAAHSDPNFVVGRVEAAEPQEPFFLFSHLIAPHPPFVRRADCSIRGDAELDISTWPSPDEYAAFAECLNEQLLTAVDRILALDPDAVIVIQADHGSALEYTRAERMPILSAIRMPEGCRGQIPGDLSPVNTFRLVFGCLTDGDFVLLPNRSYWLDYEHPAIEDITAELRELERTR